MTLRRFLLLLSRLLGDANAVKRGKVGRRIARRLYGKWTGRLARRLFG
jgi:hypothetical protein